jgi:hypothetical protein
VAIRMELAKARLGMFVQDLAVSLDRLAARLSALDRYSYAETVSGAAANIRQAFPVSPDASTTSVHESSQTDKA